jgi:hypothetical protein
MSFDTHESIGAIMNVLKNTSLPGLSNMLKEGVQAPILHPTVEMLSSLIARYERGEIVEIVPPQRGGYRFDG